MASSPRPASPRPASPRMSLRFALELLLGLPLYLWNPMPSRAPRRIVSRRKAPRQFRSGDRLTRVANSSACWTRRPSSPTPRKLRSGSVFPQLESHPRRKTEIVANEIAVAADPTTRVASPMDCSATASPARACCSESYRIPLNPYFRKCPQEPRCD